MTRLAPEHFIFLFLTYLVCSCSGAKEFSSIKDDCVELGALASNLSPKFPASYYVEQGVKYFESMQSDIPITVQPKYSALVIRWEWPPWLLLTGFKKSNLINSDILLKLSPTKYDKLDCKYFETQPFCRCHVVFNYGGILCPIYEEFTFNNQGEITFIEAWSDYESLLPMNAGEDGVWDEAEYWGMKKVNRLSTKVPGLGNAEGRIYPESDCMKTATLADKDVKEMITRLNDPVNSWVKQLLKHRIELQNGCHPPLGDVYPYYVQN